MIAKRHVLVVLVVLSVAFAGCAGWGTDGPVDSGNDENQSNETDDLEDADNETNASSANESSGADDGAAAPADDSPDDSSDSGASDGGSSDGGTDDSGAVDDDGTSAGDGTDDSSPDDGSDESDDGSGSDGQDGNQSSGDDDGDEAPPSDGSGDGNDSDDDDEAPYGTLSVTVEDDDGEPVEGVEVVGTGPGGDVYSATTDENGQATFDLEDGEYTFSVTTDGTEYDASSEEELTMDGEDQSITLTVTSEQEPAPETHTLTVTGVADGVEVQAEADAELSDGEVYTATASDGQATLEVPEGGYIVTAEGYHGADIHVDSDTEITLQNLDGATIEITVVDAQTGEPVPGAVIEGVCHLYYSSGDSYITGEAGEDGVIQAEAEVTPTDCDANIYADGYEETVEQISVPDDDGPTVELEPETNGTNETEVAAAA